MAKFLDITGVRKLWEKAKAKFASKAELSDMNRNLNNNYSSIENSVITLSNNLDLIDTRLKVVYEMFDDLIERLDKKPSEDEVDRQIKKLVPFTLRFGPTITNGQDLNRYDSGATIFNLDGKYQNSPLDGMLIYGSLINFVRYEDDVYDNIESKFIYQFILLSSGRIFNRTRWNSNWNAWKEIERVNPKL